MVTSHKDNSYKPLQHTNGLFSGLPASSIAFIASVSADITMVIEGDGTIIDVAYRDSSLEDWNIADWRGNNLADIVTPECTDKINSLLQDSQSAPVTRQRQVNHPKQGQPDLPIAYRLVAIDDLPQKLVIGEDFRKMADIQQRLVETQFELETEYRKIREAEGRYRTIFQKSGRAIVVIDGENAAIMDSNNAAATYLGTQRAKLSGEQVSAYFTKLNRAEITTAIDVARHSGSTKTLTVKTANTDAELEAQFEPYRENGRTNIIMTLSNVQDENQPAQFGADSQIVLDCFPEALVITDMRGAIIEANNSFLDLVHVLNKTALLSRNLNSWVGASTVDMQVLLTRLRDERQIRQFSSVIRDELGETTPVMVSASRYGEGSDAQVGIFITDSVRREGSLTVPSPGMEGESSDFAELVGRVPLKELIREATDVIEKMCIEAALRQTDNNRASAADMLGLSRQSLYIKLRRHGLESFNGIE